jgi:hypothetical protein
MIKFIKKDDGLVTIEWVGIAAVMVLAAIAVTTFVMNGTTGASNEVENRINAAETMVRTAPAPAYVPPANP